MRFVIRFLIVLALLFIVSTKFSQVEKKYTQVHADGCQLELEAERLSHLNVQRDIDTSSLNLFYRKGQSTSGKWMYYSGATFTYAQGSIETWNASFQKEKYQSSALGVGPVLLARYEPLTCNKILFNADMSLGLIFYNKDFPSGGDFYNFMWRLGPNLSYQIKPSFTANLGYRLMHVSNGQSTHNPSYNGKGFTVSITKSF